MNDKILQNVCILDISGLLGLEAPAMSEVKLGAEKTRQHQTSDV